MLTFNQLQKKILVITNLYPVAWAPNRASFNKQQFDRLAQSAHTKIFVLVPFFDWLKNRKKAPSDEITLVPYFYIPKIGRALTPFFQLVSLILVSQRIKKYEPDSIIASWAFPDAVAVSMFCKLFKFPFVVKAHGSDINENLHKPLRQKLMRKWLNNATRIFCASNALATKLESVGINKTSIETNYNGVDKTVFFPTNEEAKGDGIQILFVGNLIVQKGVCELYQAFKSIQSEFDYSLTFVGTGNMRSKLESWVAQDDLSSKVKFCGSLKLAQVADKIRHASILVLPSYREGVPNVLLEAFASGIPVVATKVGGIPEVVVEETGILVDAQDTNSLISGMKEALSREWDKNKILNHSKQFDWDSNIMRLNAALTSDDDVSKRP
jgi:glycosyltransferase involved in cell wall biosynthesis